jgi:hypothetical protein
MSLMNVARIAKVVALLAFVLPWVAVSCNTVDIATATGIELIQGKMTENPEAGRQISARMGLPAGGSNSDVGMGGAEDMPDLGLNFFGVAAAAVIAVGLVLSFLGKGRNAARNVLVTSLLGMALAFGTVWWWKDQVKRQGGSEGETPSRAGSPFSGAGGSPFGGGGIDAMGARTLDEMLQERFGYWITLGALALAAGAGALGMAGGAAGAGGTKPEPGA